LIHTSVQAHSLRLSSSSQGHHISPLAQLSSAPHPLHITTIHPQVATNNNPHKIYSTPQSQRTAKQATNYGPFNCSIHHRHSWSRYYRGCWHPTCPPIHTHIFTLGTTSVHPLTASHSWIRQVSRLLPSLDVVAISQAPSPESNPNPPYPVTT